MPTEMHQNWEEKKVDEVCSEIIDCINKTAPSIEGPTEYKMLRTTNVRDGWVNTDEVKYVDHRTYEKWVRRGKPKKGDVILTREAPLGEVGMLRNSDTVFLGQRLVMYRADPEKLDNRFLLYAMQDHYMQSQINAYGSGSTVEHMRVPHCKELKIKLPPLKTQQKIASILSAFDDLIENNTRRIAILEEIARLIYREWFVYYRYPGHENDRLVDSGTELGDVPEGWGVTKIDNLVSSQYGYTESASDEKVGPKFIRGTDINKTSYINWPDVPYCPIDEKDFEKFKVNLGDILVIRMADPGKLCIIEEEKEAVFASYLIRLVIDDERITPYYLFYLMSDYDYQGYISGASTGTTRKSASAKVVKNFRIVIPPLKLQNKFVEQISTLRKQLNTLLNQSNKLKETRDLLLPRLISGKIPIEI